MEPELSLVIPFCDVDLYLSACLDSVAAQTLEDLEVLMVDDGSTDGSRKVAEGYARSDGRFRLIHQDNRGPGAARNLGLRRTRGRYIGFVDSDDVVPPNAFERLVDTLRETGSDIACGGVRRFNSVTEWESPLHAGVFDREVARTHITRDPALLKDRTVWNKVYRRSFWQTHDFTYPEHPYEDGIVAVSAHVLATAVDLVPEPVYFWRQRDAGPLSITQQIFEPKNLDGRMRQVRAISDFLGARAPALRDAYDLAALEHDLIILLTTAAHLGPGHRDDVLSFTRTFLAGVPAGVTDRLGAENVECYALLRDRRTPDLFRHLRGRQHNVLL
ncbi:glycosyl transferase family 2 [Actinobacteria bacterium OK074]|nr:glycosyl transferase family 2 [Actinobacteria bacterium OK074]